MAMGTLAISGNPGFGEETSLNSAEQGIATGMVRASPEDFLSTRILTQNTVGYSEAPDYIARLKGLPVSKDAGPINDPTISADGAQFLS